MHWRTQQVVPVAIVTFCSNIFLATFLGCSGPATGPTAEGQKLLLLEEPTAVTGVVELKNQVITGIATGPSTLVGRVGGGQNETWDTSRATFLVRDLELKSEEHDHGGDHSDCKFCQAEKAKELQSMALVRMVDQQGRVIGTDARPLLGIADDQVVVAEGTGSVDDSGTFVFDATKVYIRK